jgi:hypothetical protein
MLIAIARRVARFRFWRPRETTYGDREGSRRERCGIHAARPASPTTGNQERTPRSQPASQRRTTDGAPRIPPRRIDDSHRAWRSPSYHCIAITSVGRNSITSTRAGHTGDLESRSRDDHSHGGIPMNWLSIMIPICPAARNVAFTSRRCSSVPSLSAHWTQWFERRRLKDRYPGLVVTDPAYLISQFLPRRPSRCREGLAQPPASERDIVRRIVAPRVVLYRRHPHDATARHMEVMVLVAKPSGVVTHTRQLGPALGRDVAYGFEHSAQLVGLRDGRPALLCARCGVGRLDRAGCRSTRGLHRRRRHAGDRARGLRAREAVAVRGAGAGRLCSTSGKTYDRRLTPTRAVSASCARVARIEQSIIASSTLDISVPVPTGGSGSASGAPNTPLGARPATWQLPSRRALRLDDAGAAVASARSLSDFTRPRPSAVLDWW